MRKLYIVALLVFITFFSMGYFITSNMTWHLKQTDIGNTNNVYKN